MIFLSVRYIRNIGELYERDSETEARRRNLGVCKACHGNGSNDIQDLSMMGHVVVGQVTLLQRWPVYSMSFLNSGFSTSLNG